MRGDVFEPWEDEPEASDEVTWARIAAVLAVVLAVAGLVLGTSAMSDLLVR
jgi:hypothetical protein